MVEAIHHDYEVSSESGIRHWAIPVARLEDTTPTESNPACVLGKADGVQVCGTILSLKVDAAGTNFAIIDFTTSMVYYQYVANTLTYAQGVPATFGAINIGDPIYYDRSPVLMAAGVYLSTSPLDKDGHANVLFGYRVPRNDLDITALGAATTSVQRIGVMQIGAGA